MRSASGRYVIAFNGEIYNFRDVRAQLEGLGVGFRTQSDTEVLLAAVEQWGVQAALPRLAGMFAFAIWDGRDRCLTLVRDRAGEKPLYWGLLEGSLFFASELKAFGAIPGFSREIDRYALGLFMKYAYVPAPHSIYRSVRKLPPGHLATIRRASNGEATVEISRYWSLGMRGRNPPPSYEEARRQAEELLSQSVREQMVADVPLGAFLSGGIDSTAIVALMQENSVRKVKTFSLGSSESAYDESQFAAAVAQRLGTDHTELKVSPSEALRVVPELGAIYDEPFADSSQIPTILVARLARREVTVALSGDAGDEVFGGYNRYLFAPRVWSAAGRWPASLRRGVGAAIGRPSPGLWDGAADLLSRALGRSPPRLFGEKMAKIARAIPAATPYELYDRLASCWVDSPVLPGAAANAERWFEVPPELTSGDDRFVDLMMYLDFVTYLPDDILVKVDRACMSASLEGRVPILDHRLVDFMSGLPSSYKLGPTGSKSILRDIVYSRVPRAMLERPKTGFGVPIDTWIRGPLRDWAESLLDEHELSAGGFFDSGKVRAAWQQHLSGARLRHHEIWAVLMFQAWRRAVGAP